MENLPSEKVKRGCLIAAVVISGTVLLIMALIHHNNMFDVEYSRKVQEARERLPEIKDELMEIVNDMLPVLLEPEKFIKVPNNEKNLAFHITEDDPKWRELYGDEFAENVKKLCSYGFEWVSLRKTEGSMYFGISENRRWTIHYEYYFEKPRRPYGSDDVSQYLGDNWFLVSNIKPL